MVAQELGKLVFNNFSNIITVTYVHRTLKTLIYKSFLFYKITWKYCNLIMVQAFITSFRVYSIFFVGTQDANMFLNTSHNEIFKWCWAFAKKKKYKCWEFEKSRSCSSVRYSCNTIKAIFLFDWTFLALIKAVWLRMRRIEVKWKCEKKIVRFILRRESVPPLMVFNMNGWLVAGWLWAPMKDLVVVSKRNRVRRRRRKFEYVRDLRLFVQ